MIVEVKVSQALLLQFITQGLSRGVKPPKPIKALRFEPTASGKVGLVLDEAFAHLIAKFVSDGFKREWNRPNQVIKIQHRFTQKQEIELTVMLGFEDKQIEQQQVVQAQMQQQQWESHQLMPVGEDEDEHNTESDEDNTTEIDEDNAIPIVSPEWEATAIALNTGNGKKRGR